MIPDPNTTVIISNRPTYVTIAGVSGSIVVEEEVIQVVSVGTQGPQGIQGVPGTGAGNYTAENKDSVTLVPGTPVAVHTSGIGVVKANAISTAKPCVGVTVDTAAIGFNATVQTTGIVDLANWTAITGTVSLVAKATYYLDAVMAGKLTTVAPVTSGQIVQVVGVAVSATQLDIQVGSFIFL